MQWLLFIVYIDDVTSKIFTIQYTILLFADNIALYCSIQSPADYVVLQADITAISLHIECKRRLKLHADKCCHSFVSRKQINSITPPPLYIWENSPLQQVDSIKYLGVVLTSNLTWSELVA